MSFLKKLSRQYIWKRIFHERMTEPLHLNVISAFVWVFGSYKSKVNFDLIIRPNNAFAIYKAADNARELGIKTVSLIEFGVATGAGIMNMAKIAERVTKETGVAFKIYGFDTGKGMPAPRDYRDHPDLYHEGDFEMDFEKLSRALPSNTKLVLGEIGNSCEGFIANLPDSEPIGYIALDVDYYYSSVDALKILKGSPTKYLPVTTMYLDDIWCERHNAGCGERLAINEFNRENPLRQIEYHPFFETTRIFRRARWLRQMYYLHVMDHPDRSGIRKPKKKQVLQNVYLK
jgi:hypothetical protein